MNPGRRILLADGDADNRRTLAAHLVRSGGFSVAQASDRGELQNVLDGMPEVILLDAALPSCDGKELCRWLRRTGFMAPIIVAGRAESDAELVLTLGSGANDYVSKPYNLLVLAARIRAHLRQYDRSDDAVYPIGRFLLRPADKLLLDKHDTRRKIRLSDKEVAILKQLYRAAGQAISREELLRAVWGYNPGVTTHTIETHVYRLRRKLERDPKRSEFVLTAAGGYRLAPEPQPVAA